MAGKDHGGKRKGSGRPTKAATLGSRPLRGVLPINHFFTSSSAAPAATTMGNTHTAIENLPNDTTMGNIHTAIENLPKDTDIVNSEETHAEDNLEVAAPPHNTSRNKHKHSGMLRSAMDRVKATNLPHKKQNLNIQTKGILWTKGMSDFIPPNKVAQAKLAQSWQLFYGYDVFTWRPDLMIPGWKPRCVGCGKNEHVGYHVYDRDPRLVYGLRSNYILNSPIQWSCLTCNKYFSSHDTVVLEQLQVGYPGIRSLFPCEMGWRSAIDNTLLELLFAAADAGMGPSSVAGLVLNLHYHHHEQCELRWLQLLCQRLQQPAVADVNIAGTIGGLSCFPAYDSEDICGRVPSQTLLCDVYCKATTTRSERMDAMQQRRIASSTMFCIDASYKVPKWLAKIFGTAMYSTLITAVNEYDEGLASYFALSDNHTEIKAAFDILKGCGFAPKVAFTDNVPRDDAFLQGCFPGLETTHAAEESNDDYPILELRAAPCYLRQSEPAIAALDIFEENVATSDNPVISFDLEWSVYDEGPRSQVSVISFASLADANVIIIHLAKIRQKKELLARIARLLGNKKYLFVGSNIRNDITLLKTDFPSSKFVVPHSVDLGMKAVYSGLVPYTKGNYGLKPLSKTVLGKHLPEEDRIRISDIWNRDGDLSEDAKMYAARDVEAGVQIYEQIKELPDLSKRLRKVDCVVGLEIDILPRRKTVVDPMASGKIIQTSGRTITGIELKGKRVLVEVTAVHKPNSGLIYTQVGRAKCRCGATSHQCGNTMLCNLRTFGDAQKLNPDSFIIVEERDRLRLTVESDGLSGSMAIPSPGLADLDREEVVTEAEQEQGVRLGGEINDIESGEEAVEYGDDINLPAEVIDELDNLLFGEDNDGCLDDLPMLQPRTPDEIAMENATPNQLALEKALHDYVASIIRDADTLLNDPEEMEILRRVLGDAFHVMDRVHVPVHHDWKAAYFSALRDAIFIYDHSDRKRVEIVLRRKGKTWKQEVAHNFGYIRRRVRRRIPPAKIVHARVKAVFQYFCDKEDQKTGKPLFNERASEMAKRVLEALLRGEISDPPGISMYVPIFDGEEPKKDKDALQLWRCLRGTGAAESAHSQYTRSFGQVRAGPMYSCAVLRNHHHRKSWRASKANRPGFPDIKHYNCTLVDSVNALHRQVFDKSKYKGWPDYDEAVPVKRSPFGIIPIIEDCGRQGKACEYLTPQLRYLAQMMGSDLPYTPVATKEEKILFKKLLETLLGDGSPINRDSFHNLTMAWNHQHVKLPGKQGDPVQIFPKYITHLILHYKKWRVSNRKKAAIKEAESSDLVKALRHNKGIRVQEDPYKPQPIVATTANTTAITINDTASDIPPTATDIPPTATADTPANIPINNPINSTAITASYYYPPPPWYQPPPPPPPSKTRKRQRQICQKCRNENCRRPWNRKEMCNK